MAELSPSLPGGEVSVLWATGCDGALAAAHLLRSEVARLSGLAPAVIGLTRACPRCGSSDHGRPVVLDHGRGEIPFVSLSRAGDTVVVAVSQQGPVGVDVERLDALRFAGFDDVALHQNETAPTVETRATTWARKESLLKATGEALHVDPRTVRLSDPDQPPRLLEWSAPNPPVSGVWMQDLPIEGFAACVTVLGDRPPRVSLRQEVPVALPR